MLIPVFGLMLWAFFRFSPSAARHAWLLYNIGTVALALGVSAAYAWFLHERLSVRADAAAWPLLAALFALLISSGLLAVGGILRNFVLFRPHDPADQSVPQSAGRIRARRMRNVDTRSGG